MDETKQPSYLDLPDDELGAPPSMEEPVQEEQEQEATVEEAPVVQEQGEQQEQETPIAEVQEEKKEEVVETPQIDYKAEYERLTQPFKANGKEIKVNSVEDAVELMQMGANYSKKMAALKPHLKLIKMLDKHGLMDESKLSYLIDLNGKNPEAIAKLVKDSGLDPMEMDENKAEDYKPTSYKVDDREIELDNVLESIKDSSTYQRTISVVSNDWDKASKEVIANTPQILSVLNAHMESGIYDIIQAELENERTFGRLQGLSDIEAYRYVGDRIQANGGFSHLAKGQQNQPKQNVVSTKPMQVQDDKLKDKKRAAAPSKPAVTTQVAKDFNPLALSDEEFAKFKPNFM
jgi:hypothetical protein